MWEAVYEDRLAILYSALVCKPEVLWQLAKLNNLRCIDWLNRVLLSSGRRQSHLYEWDADAVLEAHLSHLQMQKTLKQAYVRFVDKKENLMGIDWFNPVLLSSGRRLTR